MTVNVYSRYISFPVTKFIRIGIADKNDNPPYFDKELYEAEVDENEDIQHTVLTVTAKDHDECKYIALLNTRTNVYPNNIKNKIVFRNLGITSRKQNKWGVYRRNILA